MTKYSIFLEKAEDIAYEIEKCVYECLNGRPGPCWINIPSDLANTLINSEELRHFQIPLGVPNEPNWIRYTKEILTDLQTYQRPLTLAGNGIGCSDTQPQLKQFIEKYQLPLVTTFLGLDFINHDHPLNIGRIGIKGNRAANFALQNANYLLILGCSLTVPHIGYILDQFAPKAKKVAIDIDSEVHKKDFVKLDKIINCDLRDFFKYANQ
jgi:acetolactate synthase-1/2/3 large subunit